MKSSCTYFFIPNIVTYILGSIGVIITIVTFVSNVSMVCYLRQKKNKSHGTLFSKAIIGISFLAAAIGQPLETINALKKTDLLIVNLLSNFFLFVLFCATYHCIAGLTFERYIAVIQENNKRDLQRRILTGVMVVLILSMIAPKTYNLYQIIYNRSQCQTPPSSWITIAVMLAWVIYCSLAINLLTKKAIKFVKEYDEVRKKTLGKTQATNIKRLKVTKKIWLVFSVIWLPYGIVNMLQSAWSVETYELLNAIARGLTFTSFTVMPGVYYYMDKNYASYIQSKILRFQKIRQQLRMSSNIVSPGSNKRNSNNRIKKISFPETSIVTEVIN